MYAAILAGGAGKRFWPASTVGRPKQFLDITGEGTMLSVTWRRIRRMLPPERILVLTAAGQAEAVRAELPEMLPGNLFSEPVSRNTAPSIAAAAVMVAARGADEPLICCPSDHLIADTNLFEAAVRSAAEAAGAGDVLVTFGIEPTGPATGYGYIESEGGGTGQAGELKVKRFHEKPDRDTAKGYLDRGGFYWNSGIFVWRPSVFIEAWNRLLPEGADVLRGFAEAAASGGLDRHTLENYDSMPSISVDFGILEKADNVVVLPVSFGWNDVGSWDALEEILPAGEAGNAGTGQMELIDSKGNIIYNPDGLTAMIGVDDVIVAVSGRRVLVCRRGESQRVREILEKLEENEGRKHL